MQAMILNKIVSFAETHAPLAMMSLSDPVPSDDEILVKVSACGVCHTELDEIEGRTPPPHLPIVLGHQVVGRVEARGRNVSAFGIRDRVGIAWIYSACGKCKYCLSGNENLCHDFKATGRDANGGYAPYMTVSANFAYRIPAAFTDVETAPLLCAGAVGYRSLKLANLKDGQNLGLTGFGAAGHLVLKVARYQYPNSNLFVFARSEPERIFAKELGAAWAGDTTDPAPIKLDAIIDTTPVWTPIVEALKNLDAGGRLVINAIRKEAADQTWLLQLDYPQHLWQEKEIKSVANVTRHDVSAFLQLAAEMKLTPQVQEFALADANEALGELKARKIRGAKVLRID
jgi:propanol-preferring alcohol dehydrogenase